MKFYQTTKPVV